MANTPRRAMLVATALAVLCPACREPQPDPDAGSDIWEPEQLRTRTLIICACGAEMYVTIAKRVKVNV